MNEDNEKSLEAVFLHVKKDLKLNVERIGNWLWVDGSNNSKGEQLEKVGFKYSKNRDKYYYYIPSDKKIRYRVMSFNTLRQRYSNNQLTIN